MGFLNTVSLSLSLLSLYILQPRNKNKNKKLDSPAHKRQKGEKLDGGKKKTPCVCWGGVVFTRQKK